MGDSRRVIESTLQEFAESGDGEPEHLRRVVRFLSYGFDKFVHGAYITAMELYDGEAGRGLLATRDHAFSSNICATKQSSLSARGTTVQRSSS
jgi:hypothetical protein